jgi:hypothetical protein
MQKQYTQMSLQNTYDDVLSTLEENKPLFLQLLEEHIDFEKLIPHEFNMAFYLRMGRPRDYLLESFIRFCVLQKVIGIPQDSVLLNVLRVSQEIRDFCGFEKVPDAAKITRFRQDFVDYLKKLFDNLVDITEPICREIDSKKADYLIYDTTGVEANVAENNPKFLNTKLNNAKKIARKNPDINPHALAYSQLPDTAEANPFVKQQYINGHFCYAHKAGILTNGLGVVRDIAFFDENFKIKHPEVVSQKSDNPELDKEVADSVSLEPVLYDFFNVHPAFTYNTFLGDSSFDSYDTYSMLRNDFHFDRMVIPMNTRNSSNTPLDRDENGTPVCPIDKTPFIYLGVCGGKNRSERLKYVCHKSEQIRGSSTRQLTCENPCTNSSYGRCTYIYPDEDLRLYPGIPRGTEHWDNLYKHRVLIERTIYLLKEPLGVAERRSYSKRTAKADLLFAGITQLVGVILAHALNKPQLYKSIRKLIA